MDRVALDLYTGLKFMLSMIRFETRARIISNWTLFRFGFELGQVRLDLRIGPESYPIGLYLGLGSNWAKLELIRE